MILEQVVGVLLVRSLSKGHFLPQVGCEVRVGLGDSGVSSLGEVTKGAS